MYLSFSLSKFVILRFTFFLPLSNKLYSRYSILTCWCSLLPDCYGGRRLSHVAAFAACFELSSRSAYFSLWYRSICSNNDTPLIDIPFSLSLSLCMWVNGAVGRFYSPFRYSNLVTTLRTPTLTTSATLFSFFCCCCFIIAWLNLLLPVLYYYFRSSSS